MKTGHIRRVSGALAVAGFLVAAGLSQSQVAQADADDISLYISAPLVQGSNASGAGTLTETFDSASTGNCPASIAVGTITPTVSGDCYVDTVKSHGGASTSTATPTYGGAGSKFAATPWYASGSKSFTITFTNPVKYVGFWWSAGNSGNVVEFLNSGTVIASYDSAQMMTLVGASAPSPWPGGNGSLSAQGGATYDKGLYFGNPRGFTSATPSSPSTETNNNPFAYFNLYMNGSVTVDAVRFSGPGFEFDNLVTSTTAQTPPETAVFATSIGLNHVVTFNANCDGATGSMTAQSAASSTNLTANQFGCTGYTFTGWNTDQGGTGTPYTNQESYDFSADLTLWAQWTQDAPTTHTVTFEPNGGSGSATTQVTSGSVALDANSFTRDGYVFAGWNTQQDGQGTPYADGATFDFSADQTLWAQWDVDPNPPAPTPDAPSIDKLLNTGLSILGPAGTTGLLIAIGAPFFLLSDRFRRIRSHGALVVHKSAHVTITTPAKFFDRLRKKNK
jgi:uncharacterized repeat protein (TIGR02543 family)